MNKGRNDVALDVGDNFKRQREMVLLLNVRLFTYSMKYFYKIDILQKLITYGFALKR